MLDKQMLHDRKTLSECILARMPTRKGKLSKDIPITIRHKSRKLNFVSDALSRLFISTKTSSFNDHDDKLDVLLTASVIEINFEFKIKHFENYNKNLVLKKFLILNKNNKDFSLIRENNIIYRKKQ